MSSRVQLALNVNDIGEAVAFYSRLFGAEPAKLRPGYANFAITEPPLKLVLLEHPGQGGTLNHLGIEVAGIETVDAEQARLAEAGLASVDERATTCCYAKQDKFWVQGPSEGERWEIYTVLADSLTFYDEDHDGPGCCGEGCRAGRSEASPATARGSAIAMTRRPLGNRCLSWGGEQRGHALQGGRDEPVVDPGPPALAVDGPRPSRSPRPWPATAPREGAPARPGPPASTWLYLDVHLSRLASWHRLHRHLSMGKRPMTDEAHAADQRRAQAAPDC